MSSEALSPVSEITRSLSTRLAFQSPEINLDAANYGITSPTTTRVTTPNSVRRQKRSLESLFMDVEQQMQATKTFLFSLKPATQCNFSADLVSEPVKKSPTTPLSSRKKKSPPKPPAPAAELPQDIAAVLQRIRAAAKRPSGASSIHAATIFDPIPDVISEPPPFVPIAQVERSPSPHLFVEDISSHAPVASFHHRPPIVSSSGVYTDIDLQPATSAVPPPSLCAAAADVDFSLEIETPPKFHNTPSVQASPKPDCNDSPALGTPLGMNDSMEMESIMSKFASMREQRDVLGQQMRSAIDMEKSIPITPKGSLTPSQRIVLSKIHALTPESSSHSSPYKPFKCNQLTELFLPPTKLYRAENSEDKKTGSPPEVTQEKKMMTSAP
ncbi:hypothetical protein PROFUN_06636 [Planoprotostelium fungivorum]|uniref:Uncharacterized protein n=1 Tax=Planoprotostelium fungivorum TaxID=1890364 RepID=A0A2P6MSU6_9EUKA|nr:hypothetical protein PROFUN_06636 [Planoprotostelium fungivorum]